MILPFAAVLNLNSCNMNLNYYNWGEGRMNTDLEVKAG